MHGVQILRENTHTSKININKINKFLKYFFFLLPFFIIYENNLGFVYKVLTEVFNVLFILPLACQFI